jgi:hypothetical protein
MLDRDEPGDGKDRRNTSPKPYLSILELSALTPWSEHAIRTMIARGVFQRGEHYFQPTGYKGQILFRWTSIVGYIEGRPAAAVRGIPLADGNLIDVEEAERQVRRLLG